MITLTRSIAAVGATALMLTMATATVTVMTTTAAVAERGGNGNGNGNRGNRGNGNAGKDRGGQHANASGGNGRGQLARELRGLNAAHANANARRNAAPNSMPGRLNTYQESRQDFIDAVAVQDEAYEEYERLIGLTEDEVAAEFPNGGYEEAVTGAAEDYQAKRDDALDAQSASEESLATLTNGTDLSAGALAELHRLLGF